MWHRYNITWSCFFCQKICQVLLNKVTDMNNNMMFLSFVCFSLRTMYLYRIPTMCKQQQQHLRGKLRHHDNLGPNNLRDNDRPSIHRIKFTRSKIQQQRAKIRQMLWPHGVQLNGFLNSLVSIKSWRLNASHVRPNIMLPASDLKKTPCNFWPIKSLVYLLLSKIAPTGHFYQFDFDPHIGQVNPNLFPGCTSSSWICGGPTISRSEMLES